MRARLTLAGSLFLNERGCKMKNDCKNAAPNANRPARHTGVPRAKVKAKAKVKVKMLGAGDPRLEIY